MASRGKNVAEVVVATSNEAFKLFCFFSIFPTVVPSGKLVFCLSALGNLRRIKHKS